MFFPEPARRPGPTRSRHLPSCPPTRPPVTGPGSQARARVAGASGPGPAMTGLMPVTTSTKRYCDGGCGIASGLVVTSTSSTVSRNHDSGVSRLRVGVTRSETCEPLTRRVRPLDSSLSGNRAPGPLPGSCGPVRTDSAAPEPESPIRPGPQPCHGPGYSVGGVASCTGSRCTTVEDAQV